VTPHRGSPHSHATSPNGQSPGGSSLSSYERLAELTELERDHAIAGRIDAVHAVQAEKAALVAALPATAPLAARPHLERAAVAQAEVTAALASAMRQVRADAVRVDRGRTAMSAYLPARPAAPGLERRG
jgi:hypothetical protein